MITGGYLKAQIRGLGRLRPRGPAYKNWTFLRTQREVKINSRSMNYSLLFIIYFSLYLARIITSNFAIVGFTMAYTLFMALWVINVTCYYVSINKNCICM